ncbi:MAG: GNAT family N-acetyltransferase [Patescibacteria group bacterium]
MNNLPLSFQSDRLIYTKPQVDDAIEIFNSYSHDPDVTKYTTWKPHKSVKETSEFLEMIIKKWEQNLEFNYVIRIKQSKKLIGMIKISANKNGKNIGYVVARNQWNKGYATEATKAVIEMLFGFGINIIQSFCDIENKASEKVMKKSGLRRKKILKKFIIHPNLSLEKRDCLLYEIYKNP